MSPENIPFPFIHSSLLPTTDIAPVCLTALPVHKSKYSAIAEKAIAEFHERWHAEVGFAFHGGSSPRGPVTAFFPPESKEERIGVWTLLAEYFFAHDDLLEMVGGAEASADDPDSMGWTVPYGTKNIQTSAMKQIRNEIFQRVLEIDRTRGSLVLQAISAVSQSHETIGSRTINDWDDFVQYRVFDYGAELILMSIVYCCELDLTAADIEALKDIWWPAIAAIALVNDVYSFNREVSQALSRESISHTMPNAVWHLMKTHRLTVSQAKAILLHEKIPALEREFFARKSEYLDDTQTGDAAYFLEMVGLGLSGNWYWHAVADRFHRWSDLPSLPGSKASGLLFSFDEDTATCANFMEGQPLTLETNGHGDSQVADEACNAPPNPVLA